MSGDSTMPSLQSLEFAEGFIGEPEVILDARAAGEDRGVDTVTPGTGAALRFIAAASGAQTVVEVGTGTGVGTLWLLNGMTEGGLLTSIDSDVELQNAAKAAVAAAGRSGSARLIAGRALEVLPRLTDNGYDLMVVNADPSEYGLFLSQALRLLRPGGIVVFNHGFLSGRIADASQRDDTTLALREMQQALRDNTALTPALLPVGDGLLAAVVN